MGQQIIPHFKKGKYAAGIMAGVEALDKMGRKLELPSRTGVVENNVRDEKRLKYLAAKKREGMIRYANRPVWERPWQKLVVGAMLGGIVIFTLVSLTRNGSSGWAWLAWGALFTFLGNILMSLTSAGDDDWDDDDFFGGGSGFSGGFGGGSSGGSFGGGFSGGGGASGSW